MPHFGVENIKPLLETVVTLTEDSWLSTADNAKPNVYIECDKVSEFKRSMTNEGRRECVYDISVTVCVSVPSQLFLLTAPHV